MAASLHKGKVDLASVFLANLRAGSQAPTDTRALGPLLQELIDRGRAAWPQLDVPPEMFIRHLAHRLPPASDPVAAARALHASDLYLACACSASQPLALDAFEQAFLHPLHGYLVRSAGGPSGVDEIKQMIRARLFVSEEGTEPKIASYAGQGPLGVWLRMVAARAAVDLGRKNKNHDALDENELMAAQAVAADPEAEFLKTRYRADLEEAFRSTMSNLSIRDRNVLRAHFLEGVNQETLAKMYRVSDRTVRRWISDCCDRVLGETRRRLAERLHLTTAQLDGIIRLLQSEIDLNISRVFGKREP